MQFYSGDKLIEPMLEHEIRLRAYDLYVQRGRQDGHALDDWLRAEGEILHMTRGSLKSN